MIRATLLLLCLPSVALAQTVREPDTARLEAFDATVGAALLQAFAGGTRGDLDLLQEVLEGVPVAPLATTLPGDWSCRTLKAGGDQNALVSYAPFDCTITAEGAGFLIDKTSGSQRLTGRIDLIDSRMILTATGFVADTDPVPYAELPADNTSDGTLWPIVGVVEQPAPDRIRILMPKPLLESDLDILDLRRKPAPQTEAVEEETSAPVAAD